jgi:hypothetical protein
MADVLLLAGVILFFTLAVGYVVFCEKIVDSGADPELGERQ